MKTIFCAILLSCVAACARTNSAQRVATGMPLAEARLVLNRWHATVTLDAMNRHPPEAQEYFVNLPDGRNYVLTVSERSNAITAITFMPDPGPRSWE